MVTQFRTALALTCAMLVHLKGLPLIAQQIHVGEPVVVAQAAYQHFFVEPFLAVHPSRPDYLLAAAMQEAPGASFEERVSRQICATFLSVDAGATWRRHDFPLSRCFDPWIAITANGHALVSLFGRHPTLDEGLFVFHSLDGGQTWDDGPVRLGGGYDHETIVEDRGSSERASSLYLLSWRSIHSGAGKRWAIVVLRSLDGGKSFAESTYVVPNNLVNLSELPVVLSDGTLLVSFVEGARIAEQERLERFTRRRAWVLRSTDASRTFSPPLFVTDTCGAPPGFQLSAFAADTATGRFRDRLYFVCSALGRGPNVLTASGDRGETWSAPVAVPPALVPADSEARRVLGLAVNNRGVLAVAHLDRVAAAGDSCQSLYFVASLDGGHTFLPAERISSAPCASFGDYFGMVATPDGRFRLLWPEVHGGVSQLRTVTVEVESRDRP